MSQNAPWSAGGSDEPYTEPADPWGDASTAEAGWATTPAGFPQQSAAPLNTAPPAWPPPGEPERRNTPIIALVVVLGLLIVGGLVTTGVLWFRPDRQDPTPPVAAASTAPSVAGPSEPEPTSSSDARFVTTGQCVQNEGTAKEPRMRIVECAGGTYKVLTRIDGQTTGQADAEAKCKGVKGYTQWYFYDSQLDSLDFVLCLSAV